MVSVLAEQRSWTAPEFHVCEDFAKLRAALNEGRIDAFLWEKYTTRPFEVAGELSFAGEVVTPWGCFCAVVAYPVRVDLRLANQALDAVLEAGSLFEGNVDGTSIEKIMDMSGMTAADATAWHRALRYAKVGVDMAGNDLGLAQQTLQAAGVVGDIRFSNEMDYCVENESPTVHD
jgi:hypothetical protein